MPMHLVMLKSLQYLMVTKVLLCVTGSVAAIKTQQIVEELRREFEDDVAIKVAVTERAKHFLPEEGINGVEVQIYSISIMNPLASCTLIFGGSPECEQSIRVTHLVGKSLLLPLTWTCDVLPSCLGSR